MIDITQFQHGFGQAFLTEDENHILLIPLGKRGVSDHKFIGIIDIIDDDDFTVRNSKILAPDKDVAIDDYRKFIMMPGSVKDDVMVYGFVRKICEECKMDMLHEDLMSVIVPYFCIEMLHCVNVVETEHRDKKENEHWIVPLSLVVR